MSEAKEAAPKKKNMMPVIIAVVVVLAGGGYFMMGGKKEEKKAPEIALSHHPEEVGEFLVNLKGGGYLSTKISVLCAAETTVSSAGDGHGGGGGILPFVNDTVISILTSKTMEEISSIEGKAQLRRELAYHINHASHSFVHAEGEEAPKKSKKKKSSKDDHSAPEELAADYEPEYPEWDNDEGPVLKVFFLTFTTQS